MTSIHVYDGDKRTYAVTGNTYSIRDKLKAAGCIFNKFLTIPGTTGYVAGWIFNESQKSDVEKIVGSKVPTNSHVRKFFGDDDDEVPVRKPARKFFGDESDDDTPKKTSLLSTNAVEINFDNDEEENIPIKVNFNFSYLTEDENKKLSKIFSVYDINFTSMGDFFLLSGNKFKSFIGLLGVWYFTPFGDYGGKFKFSEELFFRHVLKAGFFLVNDEKINIMEIKKLKVDGLYTDKNFFATKEIISFIAAKESLHK